MTFGRAGYWLPFFVFLCPLLMWLDQRKRWELLECFRPIAFLRGIAGIIILLAGLCVISAFWPLSPQDAVNYTAGGIVGSVLAHGIFVLYPNRYVTFAVGILLCLLGFWLCYGWQILQWFGRCYRWLTFQTVHREKIIENSDLAPSKKTADYANPAEPIPCVNESYFIRQPIRTFNVPEPNDDSVESEVENAVNVRPKPKIHGLNKHRPIQENSPTVDETQTTETIAEPATDTEWKDETISLPTHSVSPEPKVVQITVQQVPVLEMKSKEINETIEPIDDIDEIDGEEETEMSIKDRAQHQVWRRLMAERVRAQAQSRVQAVEEKQDNLPSFLKDDNLSVQQKILRVRQQKRLARLQQMQQAQAVKQPENAVQHQENPTIEQNRHAGISVEIPTQRKVEKVENTEPRIEPSSVAEPMTVETPVYRQAPAPSEPVVAEMPIQQEEVKKEESLSGAYPFAQLQQNFSRPNFAPEPEILPTQMEDDDDDELLMFDDELGFSPREKTPFVAQERVQENVEEVESTEQAEQRPQSVEPQPSTVIPTTLIHPALQKKHDQVQKPSTPLPTLDLLNTHPHRQQTITSDVIEDTSARIEKVLNDFGVKAEVKEVLVGPVVTRYELGLQPGTKAAKITNLESDLARGLLFSSIRVAEVIPGKPYVGIEAPNASRQTVYLRDVLDSPAFRDTTAILPMALGEDISGDPVVVDLAKMPHLLVAGETGSGKSVGINSMILSLLFKVKAEDVKFIMIDPKVVELEVYNHIPHLLTPVVTDMKKAANALRWCVDEMERRYQLLAALSVRNIEGYNKLVRKYEELGNPIPDPTWRPGDTMDKMPPYLQSLPYIMVVVDEFADLMMQEGKQIEELIARLAQKARAIGIHLILATQRPSVDVITGLIKANVPTRIAFSVASKVDSRTILDRSGAEALLGNGDMLYAGKGAMELRRVHGAFMTDDEVVNVAQDWRARGKPQYIDGILEYGDDGDDKGNNAYDSDELDALFDEVTEFVINTGTVSTSSIQRHFRIGFPRAARIVDQLEAQGIVSAPQSNKQREVLARSSDY